MVSSASGGNPGRSASRMLNRAGRRGAGSSKVRISEGSSSVSPEDVSPASIAGNEAKSESGVIPEAGSYDIDWDNLKSGRASTGEVFRERVGGGEASEDKAIVPVEDHNSVREDTLDLLDLPAPLVDPSSYGVVQGDEVIEEGDDSQPGESDDSSVPVPVVFDGEDFVPWEIVFIEGEDPRLVVRAALIGADGEIPGEDDEVPVVESSVALSAEDVDRLIKYTNRVEKFHSKGSRFGRRFIRWVMQHKFFAGFSFTIVCYLVISEIVRSFS